LGAARCDERDARARERLGEKAFAEFFEKYGGQCLICVVDNNKALQAENERLRAEQENKA